MDKKGVYHAPLLYLILGVMILGISLFFIFNEAFGDDIADREVCAQSIQLRALAPEFKIFDLNLMEFKSDFPLKCKTRVVEVSESDVRDVKLAQEKIVDAMADCWALYGNGDYAVFPSEVYGENSVCVPCIRIHLSDEAKKYMAENNVNISIKDALDLRMTSEFSYYSYLKNSGKAFPALDPASSGEFNLEGDIFRVDEEDQKPAKFFNRFTQTSVSQILFEGSLDLSTVHINKVYLPEFFYHNRGDMLINYGVISTSKETDIGSHIPYLFYFQSGQRLNPFDEVKKKLIDGLLLKNVDVCEQWEGIPG